MPRADGPSWRIASSVHRLSVPYTLGFTITTLAMRSERCNDCSSSTDAGAGVYVRVGDNGNLATSPMTWVWQSHAPAGTSKFTGVTDGSGPAPEVTEGRPNACTPAAAATLLRTARLDNMVPQLSAFSR